MSAEERDVPVPTHKSACPLHTLVASSTTHEKSRQTRSQFHVPEHDNLKHARTV